MFKKGDTVRNSRYELGLIMKRGVDTRGDGEYLWEIPVYSINFININHIAYGYSNSGLVSSRMLLLEKDEF